jgi:hypothetical protein
MIAAGLLVVFAVLFGWHYFLYFSTVRFFGLGGGAAVRRWFLRCCR